MENSSKFKFFRTKTFYKLGKVYAIITGSKSEINKQIETEYFYYVTQTHKNFGFKVTSNYFESIDQFWDNCVIENLKEAIYFNELVPILEEIKDYTFYTEVELQELKNENIISLSIENNNFIEYLKKHTKCDELKKFLTVLPIIKKEKIITE